MVFFQFTDIPVYEGTYVTNRYTVNTQNVNQKFYVNDENGDTTTLLVDVFENSSSTTSQHLFKQKIYCC